MSFISSSRLDCAQREDMSTISLRLIQTNLAAPKDHAPAHLKQQVAVGEPGRVAQANQLHQLGQLQNQTVEKAGISIALKETTARTPPRATA